MTIYLSLKLVHVISATLLLGTGLGTAFFLWNAVRSGDRGAIRVTARNAILADWVFTTPAVIIQPVTGVMLMVELGFRFDSAWFVAVTAIYLLVGACWIPVVIIQYRLWKLANGGGELPAQFYRLFRRWCLLGGPAFTGVLVLFVLMVFKPGI
ncbi:MAG: DUF2269 domain-containing protein [Gammaproteobacteria bacterium]|nr:DUF2269 domain-containing protein [Gammaproteobacteria bacterium]